MKYFQSLLIFLGIITLNACSNTGSYQEPAVASGNTGIIEIKNENFVAALAGQLIMKPQNRIYFNRIDGKPPTFSSGDSLRVLPGKHIIVVKCSMNGMLFGTNTLVINVQPRRTYTISYPEYMKGFTVDLRACQKLRVS